MAPQPRQIAIDAARRAGYLIREQFGRVQAVELKGERDLVTAVDRAAEALIVEQIRSAFPDHTIVAEEGTGGSPRDAAHCWFVDPLDGTTNYAHGYPFFAVSVAYAARGELRVGVVYDPLHDELFAAEAGAGAYLNARRLRVSATATLQRSLLISGFPYGRGDMPRALHLWTTLMPLTQGLRRDGAAALDLCYVAAGRCDGFWERHLQPWDMAAGALIVQEAGGQVSDFRGGPLDLYRGEVVATNGRIHDELVAALVAAEGA
ncbi:MAG: inositol monophosphatase [Chloroflexi bacterium]|nr:inositol monophosphatase [Chloroflexota bacterium]